jgi:Dcp1-like decapping family
MERPAKHELGEEGFISISNKLMSKKDTAFVETTYLSPHAVLYRFDGELWHDAQTEGPLYLYRRKSIPTTALFLINRKSPLDTFIPLDKKIDGYEVQGSFLIVRREAPSRKEEPALEIYGFWFQDPRDTEALKTILKRVLDLQRQTRGLEALLERLA